LISPEYFGSDIIWYIPPDQKVNTNTKARAIFGKDETRREFTNALIYRLQRKGSLESDVDNTSISHQLLVIWKYDHRYEYYIRVLLIKHDNTIILNEDKLKELDYPPFTLLRNGCNIKNKWLLDNATALIIKSEWEVDRAIKIIVSGGTGENGSMESIHISTNM
jgi:hypothetical protein